MEAEFKVERLGGYVYMPSQMDTLRNTIVEFTCRKLPHLDTLFGIPNIPGTPDLRDRISRVAATAILQKAVGRIINWLGKEIEKDGVDALRKFMLDNKQ